MARSSSVKRSTARGGGDPAAATRSLHAPVRPHRVPPVERHWEKRRKKIKRDKVIRDSFTMPVTDYELIGTLKHRCLQLGIAIKKSELLRAGIGVLARLPEESLAQVAGGVESVKTGRPPGRKKKKMKRKKARAKGKRQ